MNINDPNLLPWLIPVGPLLAFFIITLITNRSKSVPATSAEYSDHNHPGYPGLNVPVVSNIGRVASIVVGLSGIIAAWLISLNVVGNVSGFQGHFGEEVFGSAIPWLATGTTSFNL